MKYFSELLNILNAMSPYLLLGFLVAGLLHVYVPKSTFNKYLSTKSFKSVLFAALVGVPLPLCSCGVIPTAMSLKKEGASNGATVSFLIATPQTGVDSILATYGVLGLPFAIIRPIVALIVGVLGGMFVDKYSTAKDAIATQNVSSGDSKQPTIMDALKYGFVEMLQDLGKWLTVGLVVAAAITAFVPAELFGFLGDYYILNILFVLLLSVPMYICSTGSIPIAVSLLMMGISPGAALIFLMAGPATNVATLTVLNKVLGRRTTILYLLSIILGAIGFALIIDFMLPVEWFTSKLSSISSDAHCGGGALWWQTASTILFIVLLINAYILRLRKGHTHSHAAIEIVTTQKFKVVGMRCNHCKANVEKAIISLPNVTAAVAELTSGIIEVEGNAPKDDICHAIKQLGFDVEELE
ncbi:MAG: permease [Rikenellaceae bacterium]